MRGALRPAQFDVLLPIEPVFDLSFRTDKDDPLAPVDNAPLIVGKIFDAIHLAPLPRRRMECNTRSRNHAKSRNRRMARDAAVSLTLPRPLPM